MSHHRCVPAPFLTKTYELVEDPSTDDIISWGKIGCTFVVWKPVEFARDLLPKYFKHNNFSSFVRQLNTYGFRKIVPERWEFANEFFRQDDKKLLCEIHRRRTALPGVTQVSVGGKSNGSPSPASNSGGDQGSSSTSSPDPCPKNYASDETTMTHVSDLSDENEKLRKDNQLLSSELAQTKKQCEELISYLSKYINVSPAEINSMMMQGGNGLNSDHLVKFFEEEKQEEDDDDDDDDNGDENEGEERLKLFGVWVKGFEGEKKKKKKRGRMDGSIVGGPLKQMKMDYQVASATRSATDIVRCVS